MMLQTEVGDTLKITWVSSGTVASAITYRVTDEAEAEVAVGSLVNSGGGSWAVDYATALTPGFYVIKTTATILGREYIRAEKFKLITLEV